MRSEEIFKGFHFSVDSLMLSSFPGLEAWIYPQICQSLGLRSHWIKKPFLPAYRSWTRLIWLFQVIVLSVDSVSSCRRYDDSIITNYLWSYLHKRKFTNQIYRPRWSVSCRKIAVPYLMNLSAQTHSHSCLQRSGATKHTLFVLLYIAWIHFRIIASIKECNRV